MKFNAVSNRGQEKRVVDILQHRWICSVLEQTGIDWEDCFSNEEEKDISILQKAKTRKKLEDNNIIIHNNKDGEIKIYIFDELIATWNKPSFVMKYDASKIIQKDKWYVEINLECSSVFDEEIEKSEQIGEKDE